MKELRKALLSVLILMKDRDLEVKAHSWECTCSICNAYKVVGDNIKAAFSKLME